MSNLQVYQALIKKIRPLPFELQSALRPEELWPRLVCQIRKLASPLAADNATTDESDSPPGWRSCALHLPLEGPWLERPAEWHFPEWFRIFWFQEQALLGCELNLSAAETGCGLQGRWLTVLSAKQEQSCRPFLLQVQRDLAASLQEALAADVPELPNLPEHSSLDQLNLEQRQAVVQSVQQGLTQQGYVEILPLAQAVQLSPAQLAPLLSWWVMSGALKAVCFSRREAGDRGPAQRQISPQCFSTLWQTELPHTLSDYGLLLAQPGQELFVPPRPAEAAYLLWPGERRSLTVPQNLYWSQPLSGQSGRLKLQKKALKAPPVLRLGLQEDEAQAGQPARPFSELLLLDAAAPQVSVQNRSREAQYLQLIPPKQHDSLRDLLPWRATWPLFWEAWPDGERFAQEEGLLCMVSFTQPVLTQPLRLWLERELNRTGGAVLEAGASALLLLFPGVESLLRLADALLRLCRQSEASHLLAAEQRPQLAAVQGKCQLSRYGQSIRALGPAVRQLNQSLGFSQGLDLILEASVFLQPALKEERLRRQWRVVELQDTGDLRLFQLRPARR